MTRAEIDQIFPPNYGGNAQISDLRLALTHFTTSGSYEFTVVDTLAERNTIQANNGDMCQVTDTGETYIWKVDSWISISDGSGQLSQLEKITEGGNTGWRLLGRDPALYGDIGEGAVDFSFQDGQVPNGGAIGPFSFADGRHSLATGGGSHAEGRYTIASGYSSHAEGRRTTASGHNSHSEGYYTTAPGPHSHTEGYYTTASGQTSHCEGENNVASGRVSHCEGEYNVSSGRVSHCEGEYNVASGRASHCEGKYTKAQNANMHAGGAFNVGTSIYTIHEIGIGTSNTSRKNAFEIYTNGRMRAPELTVALHDDPRSLVTKEYVDAHLASVTKVTEAFIVDAVQETNQKITLLNIPLGNEHIFIFLNGLYLLQGGTGDYTITGSDINFIAHITQGNSIVAKYSH